MDRYLFGKFVFDMNDELYQNACLAFSNMAKNIIRNPNKEKVTFNYYPQDSMDMQLVIEGTKKANSIRINNLRMHHSSEDVWKLKILTSVNENNSTYLATRLDGNGLVSVRFVNEQVLEKIECGSIIEAQMIAFALAINIYKDDKAYESSISKSKEDKGLLLNDGFIGAIDFIVNNSANLTCEERQSKEHLLDNLVDVRGTVISCCKYPLNMFDMDLNNYYLAEVMTDFGKLTIIIPRPFFPDDIEGFGIGNIIVGKVMLSGDVCIYDYDKYASELNKQTN